MALSASNRAQPILAARKALRALSGVEEVFFEGEAIWLVCQSESSAGAAADAARALLRETEPDLAAVPIRTLVPAAARDRERVRFETVERFEEPDMRVHFRVVLEWQGIRYAGDATGEKGEVLELRTAALAAVDALERVTEGPLNVRLAGVKQVRAFDAELMVVSLYRPGPTPQKFLGTVLVSADPRKAAALAVLHALNRTLGNYLSTR